MWSAVLYGIDRIGDRTYESKGSHNRVIMSTLLKAVASAVVTVDSAGRIIKEVLHSGSLGIVDKATDDLQTEADRSAQKCIVASLGKRFPKMKIIGEEGPQENLSAKPEWVVDGLDETVLEETIPTQLTDVREEDIVCWVDPLDGTKEYTQGLLDHVTVLVGFAVEGRAVAGVVHQPFYNYQKEKDIFQQGRTMWGIVGLGVRGINVRVPPANGFVVTTTRSHSSPTINACIDSMKPTEIIRVGGAGHKVLLLMEGEAHAYVFPSPGCKKWDTCAPEALLVAAGGALTDIHGNAIQYHAHVDHPNWGGVLAAAKKDDIATYLRQVPKKVRDVLPVLGNKSSGKL
ncbi:3'(2'),5'-bisphosphate nucleotidase 1-like isoform X2 [Varroa jacobsoni]|uniref:3'(2'),5'-bisphosphate nucleotidase 1-like isoform X2 n=1 Tax=Varroa jacobsoni TaxID=62625 RepID=UPI000BF2FE8E|nr:3'(2'),5'-bisphosphate nucleotidase 1-like isoform X2 [Varroa jacobsoni]